MTDLKSTCESLKRANEKLQAEAERDKQRVARTEEMTNTKEFQALSEKVRHSNFSHYIMSQMN